MQETADAQGAVIGVGTILVVGILLYGTIVNETPFGVDRVVLAGWVLAGTLFALALVYFSVGQYDYTWGFGGIGASWLFILMGSGNQILLGYAVFVLSGIYVVLVTLRLQRDAGEAS